MEIALIIILSLVCLWFTWRLVTLRKGIEAITAALKTDSAQPDRDHLPKSTRQDRLSRLTAAVCDSIAEAQMEKAVADGRRKILDFVLNQIEDCLFIVDENQEIRYANAAAKLNFASDRPHEGAQLIEVCFDHRIVETVTLALRTGGKMQDEIDVQKLGRTFLIQAEPIDPALKIGQGAWLMIRDRTEAINLEQTRKDFVANASHELKTPLSIIAGYLEVLAEEGENDMVQVMQKHTDRITRIVDDMLTISKLESSADDRHLKMEPFDLGESVHGIVEQLQPLIEQQNATVDVNLPKPDDRQFVGDRFYFDQIFFNLIENALKQNPTGDLRILVKIKKTKAEKLLIEVTDNGVGIPSSALPEVFKRFYRVEKHHAQTTIKGTGLGLSIVKRAVEAHHGQVSVTSEPGVETCFLISLPVPKRAGFSSREKTQKAQ